MTTSSVEEARTAAFQEILDEREIREVMTRYCRGVDRCDEDLVRSVYHDDSYDDHGIWKGNGKEFAAWVVPLLRDTYIATMHFVGNSSVKVAGDEAGAETYCIANHVRVDENGKRWLDQFGCRYVDRYARRAGRWAIVHRTVVHDWDVSVPIEHDYGEDVITAFAPGVRERNDPAYAALGA